MPWEEQGMGPIGSFGLCAVFACSGRFFLWHFGLWSALGVPPPPPCPFFFATGP
jgi:hypothetical protein